MLSLIGKPKWLLVFLAAAFVVPYVALDKQLASTVKQWLSRQSASGTGSDSLADVLPASAAAAAVPPAPLCDLKSALSFDVTPQWVSATWPGATSAAGDPNYAGLRVPLVSGMMPDDVAGTLTYYFDESQRVQRITFAGSTRDARRIVSLVTSRYGLAPQPTREAGLYQTQWNGQPISTLVIAHASATGGAATMDVQLDLKRADARAGLAGRASRLLGW